MEKTPTPVRHIVIFKYREGTPLDQIDEVTLSFRALQDKIPGILSFEHGVNDSPEGKNLGFTHVYTLTFDSPEARDIYLPHPQHQQFGALLQKLDIVADIFVIDYLPVP